MILINFFKILFFVIFIYLIYSLIKFILTIGKVSREQRDRIKEQMSRRENVDKNNSEKKDSVIELDEDQYKVE